MWLNNFEPLCAASIFSSEGKLFEKKKTFTTWSAQGQKVVRLGCIWNKITGRSKNTENPELENKTSFKTIQPYICGEDLKKIPIIFELTYTNTLYFNSRLDTTQLV